MFLDELMDRSLALADSGALWRARVESLYLQARMLTEAAGLAILQAPAGEEFLIGDVPTLILRADRSGVGPLGGIALAEASWCCCPWACGMLLPSEKPAGSSSWPAIMSLR